MMPCYGEYYSTPCFPVYSSKCGSAHNKCPDRFGCKAEWERIKALGRPVVDPLKLIRSEDGE
jgi:hypothetical protein